MEKSKSKRVALISGHYLETKRRAGFHWLADAFHRRGDEVLFFTAPISWLSWLKKDHRFQYPVLDERNRMIEKSARLWSFVWFTAFHPANFRSRFINWVVSPLLRLFPYLPLGESREFLKSADLIIFESTTAITLFPRIQALNPSARKVYRVSDDLGFLKNHPLAIAAESRAAGDFDLVSVPTEVFLKKFSTARCEHQLHGIRKDLFDQASESPYESGTNAVFVGVNFLDRGFLEIAARLRPEWHFHIIGPFEASGPENIHWHGERSFEETVPYLKFADIGLLNLVDIPGAACFTDSLKTIQYSYCALPIIAPNMLESKRSNFFFYQPENRDSIDSALTAAITADRSSFTSDGIHSWDELAEKIGL